MRQLTAFKNGECKNEMMLIVMQRLSEQHVADRAAYYAAIEVMVKIPLGRSTPHTSQQPGAHGPRHLV